MQKRNILSSPRLSELKRQRRKAVWIRLFFSFFVLTLIFFVLSYLSGLKKINIAEVEVVGNKIIKTEDIRVSVQNEISSKYFWLFPKTNVLFYPQNKIKKNLQEKFKRIKDVNFSIENNRTKLLISITEREPKYLWCGILVPSLRGDSNKPECYFMDSVGYIFDEAPYFSPGVYFKFYGLIQMATVEGDQKINTENPLGQYFLKDKFVEIAEFKNNLETMKLSPDYFWLTNQGEGNFFLSSKTTLEPQIRFKLDSDFENLAENLDAALDTDPFKTEFKNKYALLQYIDLRFGNKVYYKFGAPSSPSIE